MFYNNNVFRCYFEVRKLIASKNPDEIKINSIRFLYEKYQKELNSNDLFITNISEFSLNTVREESVCDLIDIWIDFIALIRNCTELESVEKHLEKIKSTSGVYLVLTSKRKNRINEITKKYSITA